MKKNFIVITGAGGFVGSFFATELLKAGYSLILIDKNKKSLNILKKIFSKNTVKNNFIFLKTFPRKKMLNKYLSF